LSQKTLIARFQKRVGLAPKMLGRVFRFQRALQAMAQPAARDLTGLALDAGYYDQAHFNHEFRQFSGLTPTEYLASVSLYPNWVVAD
jgi:methylphosphotriester-DNA--protein-cysteine methyltransferase